MSPIFPLAERVETTASAPLPDTFSSARGKGKPAATAVARGERRSPVDVRVTQPLATPAHRKANNVELKEQPGVLFDPSGPRPDDVEQGDDGDCFVLAPALAAAATSPDFIRRAIEQVGPNTYRVSLFIKQEGDAAPKRMSTVVDTQFYMDKDTGEPVYCKGRQIPQGRVLWPMILEKACTQLLRDEATADSGSYAAIDGGYEANTLLALTGHAPEQTLFRGKRAVERTWTRLVDAFARHAVVVMGTPGEAGTETENPELNALGILGGHVYGVLAIREHEGQRLVTLQNPWRSFEPGDTDTSGETSTPEDGKEDGTFEKPVEWLVAHFSDMHVSQRS